MEQAGTLGGLRERNRLRVIDVLRRRGAASRAELARRTGLSRTTVSSLVADLQRDGLVSERAADEAPRGPEGGRPGVLVALDPAAGALAGVDFGHDRIRMAISDLAYEVLAEDEHDIDIDDGADAALDAAEAMFDRLLAQIGMDRSRVQGAGMGLSGPIDHRTGRLRSNGILPGWVELRPADELSRRLGVPVHLDNDANVGALGEWMFGAGRGAEVMAYLRLSAGVGLGLILGGQPFRGASGTAGELGHVLADIDGPICRCGNRGCLEAVVAGPALVDPLRVSHGELSVADLLRLAAEGDRGCQRVIQDAARTVGRALAAVCTILNPDLVVIGGDLAGAGDLLLEPLREAVRTFTIPAAADSVAVVPGVLAERAELLGALALAGHESGDALGVAVPTPTPSTSAPEPRRRVTTS